ncbi:MAG: endonuclease III domain-containing protein [Nitrospirae bacterium]|nr:endonuclease III domain-containing protein [Nitrospirota bacterium]
MSTPHSSVFARLAYELCTKPLTCGRILKKRIHEIYRRLYSFYGPQHWWPGDSPFEVAVGAILTQNTNWSNVEKAIANLKSAQLLNARAMHNLPAERLASLIRPSGYFNIKTGRLKAFFAFLMEEYGGSMKRMGRSETGRLRAALLNVHGIGPETADSILLYALDKPVFVVDVYTRRVLSRHGIIDFRASYDEYQQLFHRVLDEDAELFNEYHALFVMAGKDYCKPKPRCEACPLYDNKQSSLQRKI